MEEWRPQPSTHFSRFWSIININGVENCTFRIQMNMHLEHDNPQGISLQVSTSRRTKTFTPLENSPAWNNFRHFLHTFSHYFFHSGSSFFHFLLHCFHGSLHRSFGGFNSWAWVCRISGNRSSPALVGMADAQWGFGGSAWCHANIHGSYMRGGWVHPPGSGADTLPQAGCLVCNWSHHYGYGLLLLKLPCNFPAPQNMQGLTYT